MKPKRLRCLFPNLPHRKSTFLFCPGEKILDQIETICSQQDKFGNGTKTIWFRFQNNIGTFVLSFLTFPTIYKYWWLMPLYWIFISHAILMTAWLLGWCRLDVDLELFFALEQNWWVCFRVKVSRWIVPFSPMGIGSADTSQPPKGEICMDKSH